MANSIYTAQNRKEILLQFVAQRKLYSAAKKLDVFNVWLTLAGAVASVFLLRALMTKGDEVVLSIVLFFLAYCVRGFKAKHKGRAARIQQFIDVTLYSEQIGCNKSMWGDIVQDTDVVREFTKYGEKEINAERVRNWYPDFSSLDSEQSILMCQKTNIHWDSDLRKSYLVFNIIVFLLIFILAVFCCRFLHSFWIIACFVPAMLLWGEAIASYISDHNRMLCMETLASEVECQINKDKKDSVLPTLIRLQKLILENREKSLLVPDWYYWCRRSAQQQHADNVARSIE